MTPSLHLCPLLPDELLSSWIARSALASQCDPLALAALIWPDWRAFTRDLDRRLNEIRVTRLASATGILREHLHQTTLAPRVAGVTVGDLLENAQWPWVVALGVRGPRRRSGPAFCPRCLAEDREPYFRVRWRLAWHTVCNRHRASLLDRCPKCGAPVMVHRLAGNALSVAYCAICNADLRESQQLVAEPAALAFQAAGDHVVCEQYGYVLSQKVSAAEWFAVTAFFIALRRYAERGRPPAVEAFFVAMGEPMESRPLETLDLNLELLRVEERRRLFRHTWPLLTAGIDEIRCALGEAAVSRQAFLARTPQPPSPIRRLAANLEDHGRTRKRGTPYDRPMSRREVARRAARLIRRMEALRW